VVGAASFLINLIYDKLNRRFAFFGQSHLVGAIRGLIDMLLVTIMVHFTGGIESPLMLAYIINPFTNAMIGRIFMAYLLALGVLIMFTTNCVLEALFIIPHYHVSGLPSNLYLNLQYTSFTAVALFLVITLIVSLVTFLVNKLAEKEKKIAELSDARIDFMNQVMHETKNPLTSIIGYTDLALNGTLGSLQGSIQEPIKIVNRQSRRMLDLVNDLLNIARIESGQYKIEKKPIYPVKIIESVIEEMKPQVDAKKVTLVQQVNSNLPMVELDETKVLQVLINLLSNSLKFSAEGKNIYISAQVKNKELEIAVRDEGAGITATDLPHIFEKFYRASKENVQIKGTGLGLALSRAIIEAHGGKMWATSDGLGKGSTFYFTLPL
ncbi:MAG: HAMP domain-containing sensor histidine kinase, partial [Candidatus Margulisbacteria bacterium]|nr:HAMP domain-containing sensor histidine kinase [Candidatus Margulisiibacteriota bacterium]